jgi:hypothetical protein
MKIIWHFKEQEVSEENRNLYVSKIKEFYKESLIVFSEKLEIHIVSNDEDYHKLIIELKDDF